MLAAAADCQQSSVSFGSIPDDCVKIVYKPKDDESGSLLSSRNEVAPCQTVPIRLTLDKCGSDNVSTFVGRDESPLMSRSLAFTASHR